MIVSQSYRTSPGMVIEANWMTAGNSANIDVKPAL